MEKEIKKRRRSVRNLRRTSGILPLNLDVLDEKPEESKNGIKISCIHSIFRK